MTVSRMPTSSNWRRHAAARARHAVVVEQREVEVGLRQITSGHPDGNDQRNGTRGHRHRGGRCQPRVTPPARRPASRRSRSGGTRCGSARSRRQWRRARHRPRPARPRSPRRARRGRRRLPRQGHRDQQGKGVNSAVNQAASAGRRREHEGQDNDPADTIHEGTFYIIRFAPTAGPPTPRAALRLDH